MKNRYTPIWFCLTAFIILIPTALSSPEVRVIEPRYSSPIAVLPGQRFNVTIAGANALDHAWSMAPGLNWTLRIIGSWLTGQHLTVQLELPTGASPGFYDICLNVGGEAVCEPRSLWVLEREPEKISIAHLSDIHVEILITGVRSTLYLETAINLVNSLPVDLAVVTGDCVDVGSDVKSLQTLQAMINKARKPTYLVPGNHDHSQTDAKSFNELYYGFYVGPANWYRVVGPFLLVSLDTGYAGYVDFLQLRWLEDVLSAHKGKVKILLMHHPLFRSGLFRDVEGSWRRIEEFQGILYASWANRIDEAREFLRLVEEYEVTAVLAGHVHTDGLVVYNKRTWFVTTVTACGSAERRGFKVVEVGRDGSVKVIGLPGRDPSREPCSFILDGSLIRTASDSNLQAGTVLAFISPDLGLNLKEVTVYLPLASSNNPEAYKVYGNSSLVKAVEFKPYGRVHLAKLTFSTAPGTVTVTLAAYEDREPPEASIALYTPRKPLAGTDWVTIFTQARDSGWGIREVYVEYVAGDARGVLSAREVGPGSYQVELPPLTTSRVKVQVKAVDFAGNVGSDSVEIEYLQPQPPEEKPKEERPNREQPVGEQPPQAETPEQPASIQQPLPLNLTIVAVVVLTAVIVVLAILKKGRSPS